MWIQHEQPWNRHRFSQWLAVWQEGKQYWLFKRSDPHMWYVLGPTISWTICESVFRNGSRIYESSSVIRQGVRQYLDMQELEDAWVILKADPVSFMTRQAL